MPTITYRNFYATITLIGVLAAQSYRYYLGSLPFGDVCIIILVIAWMSLASYPSQIKKMWLENILAHLIFSLSCFLWGSCFMFWLSGMMELSSYLSSACLIASIFAMIAAIDIYRMRQKINELEEASTSS